MNVKKIKAWVFLARHVASHFLGKLTLGPRSGLESFLDNYRQDRIVGVDASIRAGMPRFSACHACRLCDTACPQISSRLEAVSPSYLVASFSRSLPDYAYFAKELFDCGDCRRCEEICPQDVPIRRIASFMREHAARLNLPGRAAAS